VSFAATQIAIEGRFVTEVSTPQSLSVEYENTTFTPPSDTVWARVTVREGESFPADFGSSSIRRRTPGVLFVNLFAPLNKGTKDVIVLADVVADKFSHADIGSGLMFQTASIQRLGRVENEFQVNVTCPFVADDFVEVK
jgi:hypothetical protein